MHITFSSSSASARPPSPSGATPARARRPPPAGQRQATSPPSQQVAPPRRYAAPARGLREHSSRRRRHATRQHMPHGTDETSREGTRDDLLDGVISETHPARGDGGGEWCRRERASDGDGVKSRTGVCASTAEEASEREGGGEPGELGVAGRHAVGVAESTAAQDGGRGCSKTRLRVCATISLTRMPARVRRSQSSRRARNAPRVATIMEIGTREAKAMSVPTKSSSGYLSVRGKSPVIRAIWCDRRARRAAGATQEWVGPHLTYVRLKGFIRVVVGAMVEGRRRQKWAVVARRPGYIFCLDDRWKKPTTVRERRFRDLRDGPSEVVTPAASPATRAVRTSRAHSRVASATGHIACVPASSPRPNFPRTRL